MRYKKYKKRRYSSRVVKMTFQSFFDISTQADSMQIISVNAGGNDVIKRLAPFFQAYKYYKLGSVSFKLIPASTLPVSPSGLSYEVDEPTVDPRDQLTPGMCRITNGEDILENIAGLSAEAQHDLYNNMMLDPRWYKWMLQTGVKRFGKPRYWQIGQLHQDKWPGAFLNLPRVTTGQVTKTNAVVAHEEAGETQGPVYTEAAGSSRYGIFQTGHKGVLGWMPTDALQSVGSISDPVPLLANVPEIELFKILTPPAYKTIYYYRAYITETVYFKEPIVMNINGYRPVDVFHMSTVGQPAVPTYSNPYAPTDVTLDVSTGGNDGRN